MNLYTYRFCRREDEGLDIQVLAETKAEADEKANSRIGKSLVLESVDKIGGPVARSGDDISRTGS